MLSLVTVEWLFALLVLIVFTNRYVFGSFLRLMDRRTLPAFDRDPEYWPSVAIVVPVYNEGSHVRATAASFETQDYPRERLTAIFIDDQSTDDTYEHLLAVVQQYPWMQVVQNPRNMGKRLGIRNAVMQTEAELVLSVDSDVIVVENSLKNLVRHMTSSRDAVIAGILAGPLAIIPAALFFICMMAFYPQVGAEVLPSDFLLRMLNIPVLHGIFQLMIFAALLESGTGGVHAINERIAGVLAERHKREFSAAGRLAVTSFLLVGSIFIADRFGLVALIAKGYRALAWLLLITYVVPLMTWGLWRLWTGRAVRAATA